MVLFSNSEVRVRSYFSGLPPIMLDRDKMKQVILNLCKNALEAMPEGGCLTLKGYLSSADTPVLEISDTGIGIPEGMDVSKSSEHQARRHGSRSTSGQPNSFSSPRHS